MGTQTTNVGSLERLGSLAAGSLLMAQVFKNRSLVGLAGAVIGADLVYRGTTGHCHFYSALGVNTADAEKPGTQIEETAPEVHRAITIGKPSEELLEFWNDPHNLAQIVEPFAEVTSKGDDMTHWTMHTPWKQIFEWDSRTMVAERGRKLIWSSLPGTELPNRGEITFTPASDSRGTVVRLHMQFEPPLGAAGEQIVKALHKIPQSVGGTVLRRFNALAETGEIPTLAQNPSARGASDAF